MICIKVEMWPYGREDRAREIGRTYIANVGGDATRGDYQVAVCRRNTTAVPSPINPDGPKPTRHGNVRAYPRLAYNMWRLIIRALRDAFPEEDRRAAGAPPELILPPELIAHAQELEELRRERDEARAAARTLAHAYRTDNRPPPAVVALADSWNAEP